MTKAEVLVNVSGLMARYCWKQSSLVAPWWVGRVTSRIFICHQRPASISKPRCATKQWSRAGFPAWTRTRETYCRLSSVGLRASPGDASFHGFGTPESLEFRRARTETPASLIPDWPRCLLMDEAYRNRRAALTYHRGTATVVCRSTATDVQDDAVNLVVRSSMVSLCEEHLHKP